MKAMFETNRLLLRRLTLDDVDNLLGIFSDPEAMRYYPATKSRKETIEWIDWNLKSYSEYGFGLWAVIRKDTSTFAGQCGLIMQRNVDGRDDRRLMAPPTGPRDRSAAKWACNTRLSRARGATPACSPIDSSGTCGRPIPNSRRKPRM